MPRKTRFVEKQYLLDVVSPEWGESYTVVTHQDAINNMYKTFEKFGHTVKKEEFKSANNGQIATGTFTLSLGDSEMGMMVGFLNSYNKQVSFRYGIGSNITICDNMNIMGAKVSSYRRKHTGDVDTEAFLSFDEDCMKLENYFTKLTTNRDKMKEITASKQVMAELTGRMFAIDNIITSTQLGIIKKEINNPSFNYGTSNNTVWDIFQHTTHAAKSFHPSLYLEGHQKITDFFSKEYNLFQDEPVVEELEYILEGEVREI